MEALGRLVDISTGIAPLDLQTARTGKRVTLKRSASVMVVFRKGIGTAGDDPTLTLKEHSAYTGGTSQNLATITRYHLKTATTPGLVGTETWSLVTQASGATIADPGGAGTSAESEQIVVFHVDGTELSDGFTHISVDVADTGTNAQLGSVDYYLYDLNQPRKPTNMRAGLESA
jgi:hypothetical protein